MIARTVTVTADFSPNVIESTASFSDQMIEVSAGLTTNITHFYSEYPDYDGEYEFTPTAETQTLDSTDKVMRHNVVIKPIPSNYGLITWNGATLTVS